MSNFLEQRANFTISKAAKAEIENMRAYWNANFPDKATIVMVAWGNTIFHDGKKIEHVMVGFYSDGDVKDFRYAIEKISGIDVVFNVRQQDRWRFDHKVLDVYGSGAFHLR